MTYYTINGRGYDHVIIFNAICRDLARRTGLSATADTCPYW